MRHAPHFVQRVRWLFVAACGLFWLAALVASHTPPEHLPPLPAPGYVLHFFGFVTLGGLFWLALWAFGRRPGARWLMVLGIMLCYAAFDELTQPFFRRHCEFSDWLIDLAGAATAILLCELAVVLLVKKRPF